MEPDQLREELLALIGAGRSLNPEYDRVLVELFLDRMGRPVPPPPLPQRKRKRLWPARVGMLAAALISTLAGKTYIEHHAHQGDVVNVPVVIRSEFQAPDRLLPVPHPPHSPR